MSFAAKKMNRVRGKTIEIIENRWAKREGEGEGERQRCVVTWKRLRRKGTKQRVYNIRKEKEESGPKDKEWEKENALWLHCTSLHLRASAAWSWVAGLSLNIRFISRPNSSGVRTPVSPVQDKSVLSDYNSSHIWKFLASPLLFSSLLVSPFSPLHIISHTLISFCRHWNLPQ